MKKENIEKIVLKGLCTGCGTCVAICPTGAIRMEETSSGLLLAKVDANDCTECGLCSRACGGAQLAEGLIPVDIDPFKGNVLKAYYGFATEPDIRLKGQSGGVTTALLSYLLASGQINSALVNQMPENGSLRPEPFMARNIDDLMKSQGSKYCPVALNAFIPNDAGEKDRKIALVGLPCHIHSLRNAQKFQKKRISGIEVTIGLFCDRTLAYGSIDYLIGKSKSSIKNVEAFRFRDKRQIGWPGSTYIRTKLGKKLYVPSKERQIVKDFFTPPRCRICFDKMNILSDISVGDAWGVKEDKDGFSVMIARTVRGLALIEEAEKNGYLSLTEINPEKIFSGQGVEVRRKQWTAYTKARVSFGEALPDHNIQLKFRDKNTSDIDNFVLSQHKWGKTYLEKKSSEMIIREIKLRQLKNKIQQKIMSFLNKKK